jgi:APA family basic amino acid/polyamine antiporter
MKKRLKKNLTMFDVTNLVVGGIVGADIYIAASFGSTLLGPASLLAWIVAGVFATIVALTFARCSGVVKQVGGPYAYARHAFGHFSGFITGWSLWLAELAALCVFPLAFATYLAFFIPISTFATKAVAIFFFSLFLFVTNYYGIKSAARTNDVLTIIKLAPLFLLIIVGLIWMYSKPDIVLSNLLPFAPLGFGGFGTAIVLIFWAYVGFELATIPSTEIRNPEKTIPKAIGLGMLIVSVFYILTNVVIMSSANYVVLGSQSTPLTYVAFILMGGVGAVIMAVGAIVSVSGSDESDLIGSVRLAYAMAADGYLPHKFARLHRKYSTPSFSLIFHSVVMFVVAMFLPIKTLIIFSVFALAFSFIMVSLSAIRLRKDSVTKLLGIMSILICIYLISQSGASSIIAGIILLLVGVPVYAFFSPKQELKEAKYLITREENVIKQRLEKENVFLARFIKQVRIHLKHREQFYIQEKRLKKNKNN